MRVCGSAESMIITSVVEYAAEACGLLRRADGDGLGPGRRQE